VGGDGRLYRRDFELRATESKFFRTGNKYLGFGPRTIKLREIVCIIFRSKMPFILRLEGDHYLLVDDCYLYGIMRSEAVKE